MPYMNNKTDSKSGGLYARVGSSPTAGKKGDVLRKKCSPFFLWRGELDPKRTRDDRSGSEAGCRTPVSEAACKEQPRRLRLKGSPTAGSINPFLGDNYEACVFSSALFPFTIQQKLQ